MAQPIRQAARCSLVKSSADDDHQFELDSHGSSKPVENGDSVYDVSRATKTSNCPSCSIHHGLQVIE